MKIDIIASALPPLVDGIGDYTARLADQLARAAAVRVLTTCDDPVAGIDDVEVVPAFSPKNRRSVLQLTNRIERHRPDWVVLQFNQFSFGRWGFNPLLPVALGRGQRGCPNTRLAVMFHEDFVPPITWKFAVMRLWQKWQFQQLGQLADVVLFSIDPWVQKYQSWFPTKPVLHLPVGSNIPRVPIDRSEAKRRLGIREDQVVVGLFGSVHAGRNLPWLHAAVRAVSVAGVDAVVLYIGTDGATVREAVGGLPVIAEGPLPADEVSRRLQAIDVYLAPLSDGVSTRRGSMMAGLEHGLAIVGTRGEATDDMLAQEHGRAMLLADVNAMPEFEEYVRTLLVDAERRQRLGSAAEALYEREFAWPRLAEKLMAILNGCESHNAGRATGSYPRFAGSAPHRSYAGGGGRDGRPVRLALVTHNVVKGGGQGRVNYELVRYCRSQGVAVHVLSETLAPELIDAGTTWDRIDPLVMRPELIHCMDFTPRVGRAVDRLTGEFDLVVANGAVLRRPHAVNICHFVHGAWMRSPAHDARVRRGPYGWYQSLYSRCNARWERRTFDLAQTVVAVSEKVRGELVGIGVPESKVRVIVNGVDLGEFRPGAESRAELGLPDEGPLALFVGDIRTPRKNLDSVLRAMRDVPELRLAVVGDARQSVYPAMADAMGVAGRVKFLGYRRDVPRLMRASDLFVFPSRYEACSLALLEALASGLPVITAATAGGSELVTPACGAVLDDPDDVPQLVHAIREFMAEGRRTSAGIAARVIAERHGWARMAADYVRLFESFAREGAGELACA